MDSENPTKARPAFIVNLVSNRKIPVRIPRCTVGRHDDNDIVIGDDKSISGSHFEVITKDGRYLLHDANSRYGTFLNGNKIEQAEPVADGDVIKAGVSLFWFVVE
ncbi:MAG: FHA domain-containing protein [Candidatus Obscuribacterales bacterium]|nr:FHA domain-containing protein [Candidatus Obscuribacterales bacterium]